MVAAFGLAACGAVPTFVEPGAARLEVAEIAGSRYVGACGTAEGVYAARYFGIERWQFATSRPPRRHWRVRVSTPGRDAPVQSLRCSVDGARAGRSDGSVVRIAVDGRATPELAASGVPPAAEGAVAESVVPLGGGRRAVFAESGRGLLGAMATLDWRGVPSRLRDATAVDGVLWAVGDGGLWRWRRGGGAPVAVALPPGLAGRALHGIFRADPFLWVRDADDQGWRLDVSGIGARVVGEPEALASHPGALRLPVIDAHVVSARRGDTGLGLVDPGGRAVAHAQTGPVHALASVPARWTDALGVSGGRLILVAAGDEVALWWVTTAKLVAVDRLAMGAPTIRMLTFDDEVWLVGVGYGVGVIRLGPALEPTITPTN